MESSKEQAEPEPKKYFISPEQLRIDSMALAEAGDARAKATLRVLDELDALKKRLATVATAKTLSQEIEELKDVAQSEEAKNLISAAAKVESGQKIEEIPELQGFDPEIFKPNTDRPAGYRSPDSRGTGV